MLKFKWKHPDERYTCYSEDGSGFYGAYWKTSEGWFAHICAGDFTWYTREFPEDTSEKKVRKECQNFINNFEKEEDKWQED